MIKGKTIVVSDLHIGSSVNNKELFLSFLREIHCETLIINGDFVDGWKIKRRGIVNLDKIDLKIIQKLIKLSKTIKIILICGNHDEFLENIVPSTLGNISFLKWTRIHDTLILHGHQFDLFSLCGSKNIAKLGSIGYEFLLSLNCLTSKIFKFSLSKKIKNNVKKISNYISSFEQAAISKMDEEGCKYVICGHVHTPQDSPPYFNSGDWQENSTYLIWQNDSLGWELKDY